MIASFLRSLEAAGVEYLLISGQAAVLYGAAAFSAKAARVVIGIVAQFVRTRLAPAEGSSNALEDVV
jgi:hypothetical protein